MAAANKNKTTREDLNPRKRLKTTCAELVPRDVLEIILSRLPLKSILRFKAVSKSWNDLILDPGFRRIHARYNNDGLFMWFAYRTNKYRVGRFDGDGMLEVAVLDLRFPHEKVSSSSCLIKASCDGFFLLYNGGRNYVLWNPITGSTTSLKTFSPSRTVWAVSARGICYDPRKDDYKIVCVSNKNWYAVYSCRDRFWTASKEFPYCIGSKRSSDPGVTIGGVSYWIFQGKDKASEIVYFDVAECGFKTLEIRPDEVGGNDVVHLTSLNGRLCLYQKSRDCSEMKIWVLMQEENNNAYWIKLTDVVNLPRYPLGRDIKPLYLTEERRNIVLQVVLSRGERIFIVYDIRNQTCVRNWRFLDQRHSEVIGGLGSLVLPAATHS